MDNTGNFSHIKKLDYRTIFSFDDGLPELYHKLLDDYFSHFVQIEFKDDDDGVSSRDMAPVHCISCGAPWSGLMAAVRWGITHGEVLCGECGWPGRAIHIVKHPDGGEPLAVLRNFPLMVHPEFVRKATDGGMPKL